jgi:hypothetical protein
LIRAAIMAGALEKLFERLDQTIMTAG